MKPLNFHKILVANRGEIALRVIGAIRAMDKLAVVIHSESDRDLPCVTEAEEAYTLGSGSLNETYLNISKIIEVAKTAHADAIHPGYGFLAENPEFAEACKREGIAFVGPSPEVIRLMGHKSSARDKARELGIPVLEGNTGRVEDLIRQREAFAYPILIKPSAGGGGKGMRIVKDPDGFEQEARDASREAMNYFGNGDLYVEKYLEQPRHIEVQVLADHNGNSIHLFERECTLQRRYQKIIEEAPSAFISPETREKITGSALELVRGIGYTNAGTVEFLVDPGQRFYFLEMNTRIQVEHPVTEMVTGTDLVMEQIRIAEGHDLSFTQDSLRIRGHAIEARIYAEDPEKDFMPDSGRIETFEMPVLPEVRIDSGFMQGNLVESFYDPMLAKVIAGGDGREEAVNQLLSALKELRVTGLRTNRDFLIGLLRSEPFRENRIDTRLIDRQLPSLLENQRAARETVEQHLLLCAATLIALQRQPSDGNGDQSPWQLIGHWRILPEITFMTGHDTFRIRYEVLKGRERMMLHLGDKTYRVLLERRNGNHYWIRINNQVIKVWGITDRSEVLLDLDGHLFRMRRLDILDRRFIRSAAALNQDGPGDILAPLNGRVVQINVTEKDEVESGDPLLVIESMKMENRILSGHHARVGHINVSVGDLVQTNQLIITLDSL